MRQFRVQLWVYLINVALMVTLCWLLIPRYGMMGTAVVMVCCSAWVTSAYGYLVWRGIGRMAPPKAGEPA